LLIDQSESETKRSPAEIGAVMLHEQPRIQEHLKIIREYLLKSFPGFDMTEDNSDPKICHRFTMTNLRTYEQFKLKVGWVRLSMFSNPELMDRLLVYGDVAGKMRDEKKGQYFYW
jgi:hypothetical protein